MRIKIFRSQDLFELEKDVNSFLEMEPNVVSLKTDLQIDNYRDYYEDGRICNQFTNYIIILSYREI